MSDLMKRLAVAILLAFSASSVFAIDSQYSLPPAYYTRAMQASEMPVAERNYQKLRELLPLYQEAMQHPWPALPDNIKLKRGSKSYNVGLLKQHLQATGDLSTDDQGNVFDSQLTLAVKRFQERHGLHADGVVGKNTLAELNVPPAVRVQQIEVNMTRWEALAPKLGDRFIMVNVPDYELYVYENNEKILSMKAIVGKTDHQTPELASTVTRIVFNPYWNIPDSIAKNDIAPKVIENPYYLDDMHIKIFSSEADNAYEINPDEVDWDTARYNGVPYHLRQEPGLDNALGLVKFEFYSSNDVYLHDTPAKDLFNLDVRDLSHGCVRLERPFDLVAYLMQDNSDWTNYQQEQLLADGRTVYVKVPKPIKVFITYITAWVDEDGVVNFRDDVYGKDQMNPVP